MKLVVKRSILSAFPTGKAARIPSSNRAFITLNEAAEEICCTRRFLEKRIEDGEIRVFRPSKRMVRVSREELERWIAFYSHGGTAEQN